MVNYSQQIVHALTVALLLALSLGAIDYVDAIPQLSSPPSFSAGNGRVTCRAIEAQILAQAPITAVSNNSYTESVRSLVVCNTIVTYHTCRKHRCRRPQNTSYDCPCLRPEYALYDFNRCFDGLSCKFPISCCKRI